MRATPETVLRRVRGLIGTAGNERSNVAVTRLVLRVLLFDGGPVPAWRADAACAAEPAELFEPESSDTASIAEAKRVCAGCPVQAVCLADVLGWEPVTRRHGIAGGLTADERDRLVAARRRTARQEVAA